DRKEPRSLRDGCSPNRMSEPLPLLLAEAKPVLTDLPDFRIDLRRVFAGLEFEERVSGTLEKGPERQVELGEEAIRAGARRAGEEAHPQTVQLIADLAKRRMLDARHQACTHGGV